MIQTQTITDEVIRDALGEPFRDFARKGRAFKKGLLTEDEYFRSMYDTFWHGFHGRLQGLVKLRLDCDNYRSFAKEFELY